MTTPADLLNKRFGDVFVANSKIRKIVSSSNANLKSQIFTEFMAPLETSTLNPVVIIALVPGEMQVKTAAIKDLNWKSLHVRSYLSTSEMERAEVKLSGAVEPQRPLVGAFHGVEDLDMRAIAETDNSKTYTFEQQGQGTLTVFTSKPMIATGGNDLPRRTTFIPMLSEANFVYEK